ncbi:MAG: YkvA family protein [Candidatus Dormibacteria bacterium]
MPTARLKRIRSLLLELPQQLRLAYCLARDPRTPAASKAALGGALAVILNPLVDIPMWIPVVGQMDTVGLALLAVRTFNLQVDPEIRAEVEEQIRLRQSAFDRDLAQGAAAARRLSQLLRRSGGGSGATLETPPAPPPVPAWYRSRSGVGEEDAPIAAGAAAEE